MRFSDLILVMLLTGLFASSLSGQIKALGQIEERLEGLQIQADSYSFISESFRKTCRGQAFYSLDEWEKTCKAMWPLDYISWQQLDSNQGQKIFCGKWSLLGKECMVYAKCDSAKGL